MRTVKRSDPESKKSPRTIYAHHASADFNRRFHAILRHLTHDVQRAIGANLIALILGGGYGRGEGGVVVCDGIEAPYNDLDLVFVVKRKRDVSWTALRAVSRKYEEELRIHIDFSRPLVLEEIRRLPCWLMWHDLVNGHIVLYGPPDILTRNASEKLSTHIASIEATRLLLNRGAGLLWGLRVKRGVESPPDADFVRRNYYKCALALGDALLITYGRFTTSYHGRDQLVQRLGHEFKDVAVLGLDEYYPEALRFKFRPDEVPETQPSEAQMRDLSERWMSVFLHVESLRTDREWESAQAYVNWAGLREPEQHTPARWLRNVIRNLQVGRWSWQYPREQLYRQLPILLGVARGTFTPDWASDSARFLTVWMKFS